MSQTVRADLYYNDDQMHLARPVERGMFRTVHYSTFCNIKLAFSRKSLLIWWQLSLAQVTLNRILASKE